MDCGWRTVVVDSHLELSLENGNLKIEGEREAKLIPLNQIREILITTLQATVSSALIAELTKRNILIIFCNSKKNPCSAMMGLECDRRYAESIRNQLSWSDESKNIVWSIIVSQKIKNQVSLLEAYDFDVPGFIYGCRFVKPGDPDGKEAIVARSYFKLLFGKSFRRHSDGSVNSALNYGYALLLSSFNRTLAVHGYNTCLGINHHSKNNQFNLSCDLLEPFRPFVDLIVFQNKDQDFDAQYKKKLINTVFQNSVTFDNRQMKIQNAIELYTDGVLSALNKADYDRIKEVTL